MKKIKDFISNNWLFVILLIPFVLICIQNKKPDNDIWFLLTNGRYVASNGIPTVDPFTIHEGLEYIMQQWASSLMFWKLFDIFGSKALLVFIYFISFLLMYVFYKICYVVSKKKNISIIITCIAFTFLYKFIVLRPQVISYLLLLLEILCLELYVDKKQNKYLIFLPFISLLLINLHASMWYFQFVFLLPFICNGIPFEKIKKLKEFRIDVYKLKPILITIFFIILAGFINPYGIDAMGFIFKSYGIDIINEIVLEMNPLSMNSSLGKSALIIMLLLMVIIYLKKGLKIDIRHFCFICGGIILGVMHVKCFSWYVFLIMYPIAYLLRDFKVIAISNIKLKKILLALYHGIVVGSVVFGTISLGLCLNYSYNNYQFKHGILGINYEKITDYIVNNYNKNDVVLYVDFNNGGYTEYRGLKSYIDGRAELFIKKFNGKSDIFNEYAELMNNEIEVDVFVSKYNFTHLIVDTNSDLEIYLSESDEYEMVYENTDYIDDEGNGITRLYVRNDVEVLE